jgi:hypothetical protein
MKVPFLSSLKACANSACVFITIGPCHATGSLIGFPDINKNRTPSFPDIKETESPVSNRINILYIYFFF